MWRNCSFVVLKFGSYRVQTGPGKLFFASKSLVVSWMSKTLCVWVMMGSTSHRSEGTLFLTSSIPQLTGWPKNWQLQRSTLKHRCCEMERWHFTRVLLLFPSFTGYFQSPKPAVDFGAVIGPPAISNTLRGALQALRLWEELDDCELDWPQIMECVTGLAVVPLVPSLKLEGSSVVKAKERCMRECVKRTVSHSSKL